jgi:membrane-associated phospholipid phosphatase
MKCRVFAAPLLLASILLTPHADAQLAFRFPARTLPSPDSSGVTARRPVPPLRWYTPLANIPRDWGRWWNVSTQPEMVGDWLIISGLTIGMVVTDDATYSPSERFYNSSPAAKKWSDFFAEFGDGRTQFMLAGAFGAYGLALGDDKALRTGTQIIEVVFASGAVVQVLKHVTGRESPIVRTTPTGIWRPFPSQIDYHRHVPQHDAFPSGHICTSMATVTVIAENYPDTKWIRPVGYTLTALVGIGMANNGIHWYSDYPLGLFLGYTFGMLAAHPEGIDGEDPAEPGTPKVSVSPTLQPDGAGLSLVLRF